MKFPFRSRNRFRAHLALKRNGCQAKWFLKSMENFPAINTVLFFIKLVNLLDSLIDEVGNNENHPLTSLMETIGTLIETYESQYINETEGNSIDALNALIEEHGLKQSDLSEIGSQGVVSEILSGKRQLNVRQIKILSNRFKVSPAVFI